MVKHWNVQQCSALSDGHKHPELLLEAREAKGTPMRKGQVQVCTPALLSLLSITSTFFIFLRNLPYACIQWLEKFIEGASNESKKLNSVNYHFKNILRFESQKGYLWMCYFRMGFKITGVLFLAWYNLVQEFLVSVSHLEHDKNNNTIFQSFPQELFKTVTVPR